MEGKGIVVKTVLGDDLRRLTLSQPPSMEQLTRICQENRGLTANSFSLKYLDQDEDMCTLVNDQELHEVHVCLSTCLI
jgi:hypothetical protein